VVNATKSVLLSYVGNFVGALAVAYFLVHLTELTHDDPWHSYIKKVASKKIEQGFGVLFLKGIGCNWMVCVAIMHQLTSYDVIGKIVAMWWPIFLFAAVGFEHCIANMCVTCADRCALRVAAFLVVVDAVAAVVIARGCWVLFPCRFFIPLGLMEGADHTIKDFLQYNLLPVSLGNIFGGAVLVGLAQWMMYSSYFGECVVRASTACTRSHAVCYTCAWLFGGGGVCSAPPLSFCCHGRCRCAQATPCRG
jgi:formate/nitrite transporter